MTRRNLCAALFFAGIAIPTVAHAQKVPAGPEFQVNTYTTGPQSYINGPRVAADPSGNFVVVWWDSGGWDSEAIKAQRYDSAGTKQGPELVVGGKQISYGGRTPAVALDDSGDFVVVWADWECGSPSNYPVVCGRRFTSTGVPKGSEFPISTNSDAYTRNPKVSSDPAGNFVVVWSPYDWRVDGIPVVGRRFDSNGVPLDVAEFQVNTNSTYGYYSAYDYDYVGYTVPGEDHDAIEVASDSAGNFMVVWYEEAEYHYGVAGQAFDSTGMPVGTEFEVNEVVVDETPLGITADGLGRFVVVWSYPYGGGIRARRFDSAGSPIEGEIALTTVGTQHRPKVAAQGNGGFVVTWNATGTCGPAPNCTDTYGGVFGRQFDSTGAPVGSEFQVNTYTQYRQEMPSVASTADGNFMVVWKSRQQDGSDDGVFGQRFADPQPGIAGKRLTIKNALPENKERNKSVWFAKDLSIVAGVRGSPNDPRCNSDPPGTIKATIRFFSDGSAGSSEDTAELPLPCENWTAIGPDSNPKGYRYRDKTLDEGPCRSALITNGKKVKAICYGKSPTNDLLYDLVPGRSEDTVNVVLTSGSIRYCTAYTGYNGKDGSDGKRFFGKDAPAPAVCPPAGIPYVATTTTTTTTTTTLPGSPSAAYLELAAALLDVEATDR